MIHIRAEFTVKLSDYGITGPRGGEIIGVKVSDEQEVKVYIRRHRKPPEELAVNTQPAAGGAAFTAAATTATATQCEDQQVTRIRPACMVTFSGSGSGRHESIDGRTRGIGRYAVALATALDVGPGEDVLNPRAANSRLQSQPGAPQDFTTVSIVSAAVASIRRTRKHCGRFAA